ncbi:MAG: argininosuccinate lyase [Candidatus Altiarchaeota archaeon]|nr:argininosuccinate lyase [Candidatus Altiarchaeota archaeon]
MVEKISKKDFLEFTTSIDLDRVIFLEDVWGSQAHAIMLAKQKIIEKNDLKGLLQWLEKAKNEFLAGNFRLDEELEDVHMNVEDFVKKGCGDEVGGKLHTARSRNDQVIVDTKLHLREEILKLQEGIIGLQKAFLKVAKGNEKTIMPGFTHMQHAQPMSFAFWATGYVSMLARDLERLQQAYDRVNINPLGACAMSGTSLPTDRTITTKLLGFREIHEHALDAVSSRDFIIETLADVAILASNLSKLAEELVLWSSYEFSFIEIDEAYCSGSSIMPQKRNPDVAELVRGRTGHMYGSLVNILTSTKGLPMGYNRDLQEDKLPLWYSITLMDSTLKILAKVIDSMKLNKARMGQYAATGFSGATALANYLVEKHKLSFRNSHGVIKKLVDELATRGGTLENIDSVVEMLKVEGIKTRAKDIIDVINVEKILESQNSLGGTSPEEVSRMEEKLGRSIALGEGVLNESWIGINKAKKLTEDVIKKFLYGGELMDF